MVIENTTTLLLSLHNTAEHESKKPTTAGPTLSEPTPTTNLRHFSFRPASSDDKPSPPISLLARIDQEEYVLLPNSSGFVSISSNDLKRDGTHNVRIVAPMTDDRGKGIVEVEGIWLSEGGRLASVRGSSLREEYEDEDDFAAEDDHVGEKHRKGMKDAVQSSSRVSKDKRPPRADIHDTTSTVQERTKILEVITDSPGSFTGRHQGKRTGGADGLLSGVLGWEYLLGEMFEVDHVAIGVDGMCLIEKCIGGAGYPAGIGDVFFRRSVSRTLSVKRLLTSVPAALQNHRILSIPGSLMRTFLMSLSVLPVKPSYRKTDQFAAH